jgi:hypothetical protein
MHMTRRTLVAIVLAVTGAAGLAAQTQETKTTTKTKIQIKGGKDVTVVGCLDRGVNGDFILTKVRANKGADSPQYALVTSEDLSKHVGERLEIRGKVVSEGNGTVSVESKTKTEVEHGKDSETKAKTEGAIAHKMPFLGVTSSRTLGSPCT